MARRRCAVQTALIPLAFAAAAGCVLRYGRSSADGRHQINWFAFAGSVTAAGMLVLGLPGAGTTVAGRIPLTAEADGIRPDDAADDNARWVTRSA
jgi:hypothetical protein